MAESQKALVIRSQAMEKKIEGLILSQQQGSTQPTVANNDGKAFNSTMSQQNEQEGATVSNSQQAVKNAVNHAETQAVNHSETKAVNHAETQAVNNAVRNSQAVPVLVKSRRTGTMNPQEDIKEEQAGPMLLKVDKAAVLVKEEEKDIATETQEDVPRQGVETKKRSRKKKLDAKQDDDEVFKKKMLQSQEIHKVKVEKAQENSAARLQCKMNNKNEIHSLKRGMEVSLGSPNSLELVALATVSNVDDKEIGPDYVEVLVNYVMKKSTMLPHAQGRINKMSNAQATCIMWPRVHMNIVTESEIVHQTIRKEHEEEIGRVEKDDVTTIIEKIKKNKRCSTDVSATKQDMSQNEGVVAGMSQNDVDVASIAWNP
ncbi:hypothetical protein ACQ4PT_006133 [Festuca glaucescens]